MTKYCMFFLYTVPTLVLGICMGYFHQIVELPSAIISNFANVVIAYAAVYAIWYFKKQKRIERLSVHAKEALTILMEVEEVFFQLCLLIDRTKKGDLLTSNAEHIQVQIKALTALNKFYNALLLIRKDPDLKEQSNIIILLDWIKNLEKILKHKYHDCPASFVSIDFIHEIGCMDASRNNEFSFNQLAEIREALLKIHEIPE